MSGIVSAIVGGVATFAAVTIAAVPEAAQALSPLFEASHEFTLVSVAIIFAVPALCVLTLLASAAKD